MEDDRFTFEVEWYDPQAELARRFSLTYFVRESGANEVEMVRAHSNSAALAHPAPPALTTSALLQYDLKTGRKFLKRCPYPSVKLGDLFIGAKVVMCVCCPHARNGRRTCSPRVHVLAPRARAATRAS